MYRTLEMKSKLQLINPLYMKKTLKTQKPIMIISLLNFDFQHKEIVIRLQIKIHLLRYFKMI